MSAAFPHTAKRFGLASGPARKKPMPQGMTSHMPQAPFHDHYSVSPESPVGCSETPLHLNHNWPKGKMAGNRFLPYQFNA
jgi:hypothetical protein